ncbi:MAG: ATPase [Clostridia bacterium]|nr:ATPase [Clostridia bacterium]
MKQLLILSGKGGTGKTTIAAAFIKLAAAKAYADCDVDAPNLHIVAGRTDKEMIKDYYGLPKAIINQELCIKCGICKAYCRFDAIEFKDNYNVDIFACEGCGVCAHFCPNKAISMQEAVAGELMLFKDNGVFSTAKLKMGSGTSGKLVSEVKKQLINNSIGTDFAIIDGSPGIGCPVIASLSGANTVLIVTEPSVSGNSDMERIISTARGFGAKIAVCVNKYDTNAANTEKIIEYCRKNCLPYVGSVPYDTEAVNAINKGVSVVEIDCPSGKAVRAIYKSTMKILKESI